MGSKCSLFVLIKNPSMPSRVRRPGQRITFPAGLDRIAPLALVDQQKSCRAPCFGGELKPSARGQRNRLFGLRDHQAYRASPKRFFNGPKQIGFGLRLDQMESLCQAVRQRPGQKAIPVMSEHHPEDRTGYPGSLEQGKSGSTSPFCFMNPGGAEVQEVICRLGPSVSRRLHASPPPRSAEVHPGAAVAAEVPPECPRSTMRASLRVGSESPASLSGESAGLRHSVRR